MSEKRLNGRIVNKHDIEANWLKATNFIPMLGEIIVYDVDDTHNQQRMKIGDGVTNVNDLLFHESAIQSDWNENDETSLSYVKNRTHYETEDGTVYQLDEKFIPTFTVEYIDVLCNSYIAATEVMF